MIPSGLKANLQQAVRASVAKTKDVVLRGEGGTTGNTASATTNVGSGQPIRASAPVEAIVSDAPGAASQALRGLLASRAQVNAVIVAGLGGTRYLVDVNGEQSAVVLQGASVQSGRSLEAGTDVRLILANRPGDPEAAGSAGRTHASLSAVGQLIGDILGPQHAQTSREPGHVRTLTTPLTSDPRDTGSIAAGLRNAVSESGLFYESHVLEWAEGKRSSEALAREPQAQLVRNERESIGRFASGVDSGGREMTAIVREQLHALDTRQVAWTGPLWPGQNGEITIGEEEPEADVPTRIWRANLALDLPTLGRVEVKLALNGTDLNLGFHVFEPATQARLDADVGQLAERFDAQGLRAQARVAYDPDASPS